jgi:hypothetical protein
MTSRKGEILRAAGRPELTSLTLCYRGGRSKNNCVGTDVLASYARLDSSAGSEVATETGGKYLCLTMLV